MADEYSSLTIKIATAVGVIFIVYTILKNILNYYGSMLILVNNPVSINEKVRKVSGSDIPIIINNVGLTYTISTWVYVNGWEYKRGNEKEIWSRGPTRLYFDRNNNNLLLDVGIYGRKEKEMIEYENFPLQKWMNVTVVVENRTVDLWINGKLYKSRTFDNLVYNNSQDTLVIGKDGGYDGIISRMYYYKKALRRNDIIRIFEDEPYPTNFIAKLWNRLLVLFFGKSLMKE